MNLYRGCVHNCAYCDGRDEKYRVAGTFESDIEVKVNAAELLEKELDPSRKRKPFEHGFFVLGGGVADAFQPAEKKYRLARQTTGTAAPVRAPPVPPHQRDTGRA